MQWSGQDKNIQICLHMYAWKPDKWASGKNWWYHDIAKQLLGVAKYLCKNRHSRRLLQLKVISKDKLIFKTPEQSGLKIVLSSIELGSRSSYTLLKCCILIGWPHSVVSILNLKLSIWWSNESFPKGTSNYNNSMDTSH